MVADTFDRLSGRFRAVVRLESLSYLVLLAAVASYRIFDGPDVTRAIGPMHGLVFLGYFIVAVQLREALGWSVWTTAGVLVSAVIPFGGLAAQRWVLG